jgi:hypothetical protein
MLIIGSHGRELPEKYPNFQQSRSSARLNARFFGIVLMGDRVLWEWFSMSLLAIFNVLWHIIHNFIDLL